MQSNCMWWGNSAGVHQSFVWHNRRSPNFSVVPSRLGQPEPRLIRETLFIYLHASELPRRGCPGCLGHPSLTAETCWQRSLQP